MLETLEHRLVELTHGLTCDESGCAINMQALLLSLAEKGAWEPADYDVLDTIARKVDVSSILYKGYSNDWKRCDSTPLAGPWLNIVALLLAKRLWQESGAGAGKGAQLKRINTIFKLTDRCQELLLEPNGDMGQALLSRVSDLCSANCEVGDTDSQVPEFRADIEPKRVPITILFYEGPIARAYLSTLKSLNLVPDRIVQLVSSKDVYTKKPVGRILPKKLRIGYAESLQKNKMLYWPRQLVKTEPQLSAAMLDRVSISLGFKHITLEAVTSAEDLNQYCPRLERLLVTGLSDPLLSDYLSSVDTPILYTGGGIVPSGLLDLNSPLIHIHPGYLPDIRGADGVLWSVLLTGRPSASAFYMAPGIDTGDIISREWLPEIVCDIDLERYSSKTVYRAIYSFLDPWIRAYLLRSFVIEYNAFADLPVINQEREVGETFYFMHPKLQQSAYNNLSSSRC